MSAAGLIGLACGCGVTAVHAWFYSRKDTALFAIGAVLIGAGIAT